MAHTLKIYDNQKIIGEIENPNFQDLNYSLDKIQFSKKSIVIEKSSSNKLIVEWDFISGFTLELTSNYEIFKDELLYPSRNNVYLILKNYIEVGPSFKKRSRWKKEDDYNQKIIARKLIISLQIITALFSIILIIALLYIDFDQSSGFDLDVIGGFMLIFLGFFTCSIYLKRVFYLKDARKAGDRGLNSSLHEFITGLSLIIFGIIIVFI